MSGRAQSVKQAAGGRGGNILLGSQLSGLFLLIEQHVLPSFGIDLLSGEGEIVVANYAAGAAMWVVSMLPDAFRAIGRRSVGDTLESLLEQHGDAIEAEIEKRVEARVGQSVDEFAGFNRNQL